MSIDHRDEVGNYYICTCTGIATGEHHESCPMSPEYLENIMKTPKRPPPPDPSNEGGVKKDNYGIYIVIFYTGFVMGIVTYAVVLKLFGG